MPDPVPALVLELLDWIGSCPRSYAEVMEAWRTSCPRLPVWEEANSRGLVLHLHQSGQAAQVGLSAKGRAVLERHHKRREPA